MDDILLKYILELLKNWHDSFFNWANTIGDKIASIKTNTDNLPGIKADTADIKDNTAAVISPINSINSNVASVASDVGSIKIDTITIKNNAGSIATSSGTTAAFAEDIANNTLDCKNRLVTIGSDTTQIRTDSDSIAADVTEIKNTLGLYLYNTIVTEDAEGSIANFDTDLQDYLQNAVVTIPADASGINVINVFNCGINLWDEELTNGVINSAGAIDYSNTANFVTVNYIPIRENKILRFSCARKLSADRYGYAFYDVDKNYIANTYNTTASNNITTPASACYMMVFIPKSWYGNSVLHDVSINYPYTDTDYHAYNGSITQITFGSSITDGAEVDLLSGIVKINTSPITYDSITPLAIRTFKGVNNIYSDIGDISVTYRETLKHYLEKQDSNSRSLNRNVNLLRENISSTEDIVDDSDRRI